MSKITRTEGLVLSSRPFRESSKIAVIFTRKSGRIDVLAHGARRPGSKFGASLEPGTELSLIYYERENKNLLTLSSADIIVSHQKLRESRDSLKLLYRVLGFLSHISHPGESNSGLYNLTVSLLNAMDKGNSIGYLFEYYLLHTASTVGYHPGIEERCVICGKKTEGKFSIVSGGFLCSEHSKEDSTLYLTKQERIMLYELSEFSVENLSKKYNSITPLISKLLRQYAVYHLHADPKLVL